LQALAPGGVCSGVGFYVRRGTPLPLWSMYLNGSTLHLGLANARASLPALLELVRHGGFDPSIVTSLVADWEDAPGALLERSTKVVLRRKPLGIPRSPHRRYSATS
jgi:alcohol dehydrogenase